MSSFKHFRASELVLIVDVTLKSLQERAGRHPFSMPESATRDCTTQFSQLSVYIFSPSTSFLLSFPQPIAMSLSLERRPSIVIPYRALVNLVSLLSPMDVIAFERVCGGLRESCADLLTDFFVTMLFIPSPSGL